MVALSGADLADAPCLLRAIERELAGVLTSRGSGDWFVFYDPDRVTLPDRRLPFTTLMTGDRYDAASWLDRDAATYRVNMGVDRPTYERLLGPAPRRAAGDDVIDTGVDYTAVDVVMPHPFYAPLHWLCVVNPAERTRAQLEGLLQAVHALARSRYDRRRGG